MFQCDGFSGGGGSVGDVGGGSTDGIEGTSCGSCSSTRIVAETGMGDSEAASSSGGDEAAAVCVSVGGSVGGSVVVSLAMGASGFFDASAYFGSSDTSSLSSSGGDGLGAMVSAVYFQALSNTEFHENDVDAGISTGGGATGGDDATSKGVGEDKVSSKGVGEAKVSSSGAIGMLGAGSSDVDEGGGSEIDIWIAGSETCSQGIGADSTAEAAGMDSKGVTSHGSLFIGGGGGGSSIATAARSSTLSSNGSEVGTDSRTQAVSAAGGVSGSTICTEASAICSQGMGEGMPEVAGGLSLVAISSSTILNEKEVSS